MIEVTQEMLSNIHTDSDVMDLADELGVSYRQLDYAIQNKLKENTPCHNCKHVACYDAMYPCIACSRGRQDLYESILEKEAD